MEPSYRLITPASPIAIQSPRWRMRTRPEWKHSRWSMHTLFCVRELPYELQKRGLSNQFQRVQKDVTSVANWRCTVAPSTHKIHGCKEINSSSYCLNLVPNFPTSISTTGIWTENSKHAITIRKVIRPIQGTNCHQTLLTYPVFTSKCWR